MSDNVAKRFETDIYIYIYIYMCVCVCVTSKYNAIEGSVRRVADRVFQGTQCTIGTIYMYILKMAFLEAETRSC